nr:hypothetical protein [Micromonospora provocatoris]
MIPSGWARTTASPISQAPNMSCPSYVFSPLRCRSGKSSTQAVRSFFPSSSPPPTSRDTP